ncbi:protein of unknown function [Methylocaldum szegediense]|uniref:Uncharacterized protein n=1 Tax=Methylocaldum szegediense TaxID=73780 RepID=A0ABM9HXX2_9GAMM|nr:protein of unknown function [Methylocaldum szegediense]
MQPAGGAAIQRQMTVAHAGFDGMNLTAHIPLERRAPLRRLLVFWIGPSNALARDSRRFIPNQPKPVARILCSEIRGVRSTEHPRFRKTPSRLHWLHR